VGAPLARRGDLEGAPALTGTGAALPPVVLTGHDLTAAAVAAAAGGAEVTLAAGARRRMREARDALERAIAAGRPVYGVTTGLGPRVDTALPPSAASELSLLTVRGRANAVGEPLPVPVVRAAMVARANGLAAGGSGAAPELAEGLVAMLAAGIHPVVPRTGSIGAGDICLLAHVGLALVGEGEVMAADGTREPAAAALRSAGIAPLALGPRDGLAICSASSVSAGAAALALARARERFQEAQVAAALSMEGFRASTTPIDARVAAARPAPGQEEAAAGMRSLLADGDLADAATARRLQDPLSFRCASSAHGSVLAALDLLDRALAPELNGAADNPLVAADGDVLPTGNFHTAALALALDAAAIAVAQAAGLAAARPARLAAAEVSGLPPCLSRHGPGRSGVAPLVKVGEALASEIRHAAAPASIDPRPTAGEVEDDSTGAPLAALRLLDAVDRWRRLVALELVVAAIAVDLAAPRLGRGTAAAHAVVRGLADPLDDDRPLGADVERVAAEALASGRLRTAVGARL